MQVFTEQYQYRAKRLDMQPINRQILYSLLLLLSLVWIIFTADKTGASTAGRLPALQRWFRCTQIFTQNTYRRKVYLIPIAWSGRPS
jgi:hypothetical protein